MNVFKNRLIDKMNEESKKDKLIKTLIDLCIKTIRGWHGIGINSIKEEEMMWNIYKNQSPEMKQIAVLMNELNLKNK